MEGDSLSTTFDVRNRAAAKTFASRVDEPGKISLRELPLPSYAL